MIKFSIGQEVRHVHTKDRMWVLRIGNEQILCRTKDLREIWFYTHELETLEGVRESRGSNRFL